MTNVGSKTEIGQITEIDLEGYCKGSRLVVVLFGY